jgi:hypothetical protein
MGPVLRAGVGFGDASRIALGSDTVSIAIMELVDNLFVLAVPGAIDAASAMRSSGGASRSAS